MRRRQARSSRTASGCVRRSQGTIARGLMPYPYKGKPEDAGKFLVNPLPFNDSTIAQGSCKVPHVLQSVSRQFRTRRQPTGRSVPESADAAFGQGPSVAGWFDLSRHDRRTECDAVVCVAVDAGRAVGDRALHPGLAACTQCKGVRPAMSTTSHTSPRRKARVCLLPSTARVRVPRRRRSPGDRGVRSAAGPRLLRCRDPVSVHGGHRASARSSSLALEYITGCGLERADAARHGIPRRALARSSCSLCCRSFCICTISSTGRHAEVVKADAMLHGKSAYLNTTVLLAPHGGIPRDLDHLRDAVRPELHEAGCHARRVADAVECAARGAVHPALCDHADVHGDSTGR